MIEKIKRIINKIIIFLGAKNIVPINDKFYIERKFFEKFNYKLDLNNPKTFNEKLQWLKLNDRKNIYTAMVDKYEAKKYVANIIGEDYIIPTLGVYNKWKEIDFDKLPNQFVIKCTHDSGGLIICKDKNKFDLKKAKRKICKSLKENYFYHGREWPYKNVKPRIIIEKYIEDKEREELIDYKFMCFNGHCKMIFTCTDRYSKNGLKVTFFDLNWNKLLFERHYRMDKSLIEKPNNLKKMIELSEKLSKDIPFIRVDFYSIQNRIYFGELTFYPGCGFEEFNPKEWDRKLGDMIKLPTKNIK